MSFAATCMDLEIIILSGKSGKQISKSQTARAMSECHVQLSGDWSPLRQFDKACNTAGLGLSPFLKEIPVIFKTSQMFCCSRQVISDWKAG